MAITSKLQTALNLSVTMLLLGSCIVFEVPYAKAAVTQIIWSTDQTLNNDFVVQPDQELVIRPGVTVKLAAGKNITVQGNLTAIGTQSQFIFLSPTVFGVPWGMINMTWAARGSHLDYCQIYQATTGIYAYSTQLYIDHSNISGSSLDGIHATESTVHITNSSFTVNGAGQPLVQAGLYLNNASGLIDNNTLIDNNHGIYLKEGSTATLSNNQITGSTCTQCAGIKVRSGSTPVIEHNMLRGNYAGIISNGSRATIQNNNITFNLDDGVLLVNHDSSSVLNNSITYNSDDGLEANSGSTPYLFHDDLLFNVNNGLHVSNATVTMDNSTLYNNDYGTSVFSNGRLNSSYNVFQSNNNDGVDIWWGSNLTSHKDTVEGNLNDGVMIAGANATLKAPALLGNKWGLDILDQSKVYIEDGYTKNSKAGDLNLYAAYLTTLNFTRANLSVKWGGNDARFTVKWYLSVKVINQTGAPLQGANVTITPFGFSTYTGMTDGSGLVGRLVYTEYYKTYSWGSMTQQYWSPYHISATLNGITNSTDINLTSTQTVTLRLLDLSPVLAVPFGNYSFNEDTTARGLVNCSEHFTGVLPRTYSLVFQSDPTKVLGKVNGSKLDFFSPTKDWNGVEQFEVRANDSNGFSTLSNPFNVTVLPIDDPPVLLPQPDLFATANETVSGTLKATDVDDPPSHFLFKSVDVLPAYMVLTLDQHSGVFTLRSQVPGHTYLHFQVSDGNLSSNIITVNITVTAMNTPPSFTSIDIVSVYLGQTYKYHVTAYDPDGDHMNLTLVDWPHGMTLMNWNLTWTPDPSQLGQRQVGLSLTDGLHPPVLHYFNITVFAEDHPPVARILSPSSGIPLYDGMSLHFKGNATDPDKDNLTYTWRIDGTVVSTLLEFNTTLTNGTHLISFAASDGKVTVYSNTTLFIKVRPTNKPYKTRLDDTCLILEVTVVAVCVVAVLVYRKFKP